MRVGKLPGQVAHINSTSAGEVKRGAKTDSSQKAVKISLSNGARELAATGTHRADLERAFHRLLIAQRGQGDASQHDDIAGVDELVGQETQAA